MAVWVGPETRVLMVLGQSHLAIAELMYCNAVLKRLRSSRGARSHTPFTRVMVRTMMAFSWGRCSSTAPGLCFTSHSTSNDKWLFQC